MSRVLLVESHVRLARLMCKGLVVAGIAVDVLGLAICQAIAQAHGWYLSAERAEPGLRFRLLHLPVP